MFKILVVEDEFWMGEGLQKVINKLDYPFEVSDIAQNGHEALSKMNNVKFDLIITDIKMPIMDGLEFIKRKNELAYQQPVVIITGHSEFEYARKAIRLGAFDYLLKPVKKEELSEVLENIESQINDDQQLRIQINEDQQGGVDVIQYTIDLINREYMKDLSLSEIADQVGFNASYLSRLFKLETGIGFVQYLREVRMKQAKEMLIIGDITIETISKKVGFQSEKHFRRTFKKEEGVTPSEYRDRK